MSKSFAERLIIGVLFGAIVIACILGHPLILTVFLAITFGVCLFELNNAFSTIKINIPVMPILLGGILMMSCAYVGSISALVASYVIVCATILLYTSFEKNREVARVRMFSGLFILTYLPFFASFLIILSQQALGSLKIIFGLLLVSMSDVGGLLVGSRLGVTPLAPRISPKKSVQGFVGSLIFAIVVAYIYSLVFFPQITTGFKAFYPLIIAVCLVIVGTFGDLCESLIKRDLDMKDMGTILASHGGMLDRIDSILIASPFMFFLISNMI